MFKYLFIIMLLAFTPHTSINDPVVPGPPNPYCGFQESNFQLPEVVCPDETYVVDLNCIDACDQEYRHNMFLAYQTACNQYNDVNALYVNCCEEALDICEICLQNATTLQQRTQCRNTAITSFTSCLNNLYANRNSIEQDLAIRTADALAKFEECAANCCKKGN